MKAKRTKVTFEFEDDLLARVSEIARERQTSVRAMIRGFIRELAATQRSDSTLRGLNAATSTISPEN